MALSIKDAETDALVRRLARAYNTGFTAAIRLAVGNELARVEQPKRGFAQMLKDVRKIQQRSARLPMIDCRSPEEIVGYDENGLPG